jgi:hypothetical protein
VPANGAGVTASSAVVIDDLGPVDVVFILGGERVSEEEVLDVRPSA